MIYDVGYRIIYKHLNVQQEIKGRAIGYKANFI